MRPIIFADVREKNITNLLEKYDVEIKKRKLEVADFIVSNIGIERKTGPDFVKSIIDGRLFEQLSNLKENFEKQLLIIEGNNFFGINPNAVRGAFSAIAVDFSVPIIYSKDEEETANYLYIIARRQTKEQKPISLRKKKPWTISQYQQFIVESLPGIGPTIAKQLLKNFRTVEKVFKAEKKALEKVERIGEKKAEEIRKILTAEYQEDK